MVTRPPTDFLGEHFRRTEQLLALCIRCLGRGQHTLSREYFVVLQEEVEDQFSLEERRVHVLYPEELRRELARQHRDLRARLLRAAGGYPVREAPNEDELREFRLQLLDHLAEERNCLAEGGLMLRVPRTNDRRKTMKVKELMQKDVVSVPADMTITELAHLLTERKISGAPVTDAQGNLVGVVSLVDLALHASHNEMGLKPVHYPERWWKDGGIDQDSLFDGFLVQDFRSSTTVADIMTPAVYQVGEEAEVLELVDLMLAGGIHRAIVTRGGRVIGIVTTTDLMRLLRQHLLAEKAPSPH